MISKKLFGVALFAILTTTSTVAWCLPGPADFVKSLVRDVDVREHVDVDSISRSALGAHWEEASPRQRQLVKDLLHSLMSRALDRNLDTIRSYQVDYTNEEVKDDTGAVTVVTHPKKPSEEPVTIVFRLVKSDQTYLITDLLVEDTSLVKSYKSQFHRVILKSGIDGLIKKMTLKMKETC